MTSKTPHHCMALRAWTIHPVYTFSNRISIAHQNTARSSGDGGGSGKNEADTNMTPEEMEITKKFWRRIQRDDARLQRKDNVVTALGIATAVLILASLAIWFIRLLMSLMRGSKKKTAQQEA